MFKIFSEKVIEEEEKFELTYSIDEYGLECLHKALSSYSFHNYSYGDNDFNNDICFLKGVCASLQNGDEMHKIICKMESLAHVLSCSIKEDRRMVDNLV